MIIRMTASLSSSLAEDELSGMLPGTPPRAWYPGRTRASEKRKPVDIQPTQSESEDEPQKRTPAATAGSSVTERMCCGRKCLPISSATSADLSLIGNHFQTKLNTILPST